MPRGGAWAGFCLPGSRHSVRRSKASTRLTFFDHLATLLTLLTARKQPGTALPSVDETRAHAGRLTFQEREALARSLRTLPYLSAHVRRART